MKFLQEPFQITDEGIRIPFFLWAVTLRYTEIKSVRKMPLWKAMLEGMNPLRSPMVSLRSPAFSVVLIETIRHQYFAVYPKDAEEFVRLISSRISNSN